MGVPVFVWDNKVTVSTVQFLKLKNIINGIVNKINTLIKSLLLS